MVRSSSLAPLSARYRTLPASRIRQSWSRRRCRQWATILFALLLVLSPHAWAQDVGEESSREKATNAGPRKQLATIVFAGLGGAVLGLSTLSFYGRPQDRLVNIAVGFAVGIISGTCYVTYKAAAHPEEFYGLQSWNETHDLMQQARFQKPLPATLNIGYRF